MKLNVTCYNFVYTDSFVVENQNPVLLILCILETPKQVFLQTVKTQMKCRIMGHFIRVYTVKVKSSGKNTFL